MIPLLEIMTDTEIKDVMLIIAKKGEIGTIVYTIVIVIICIQMTAM